MTLAFRTQRRVLRVFPFAEEAARLAHSQHWVRTYDVPRDEDLSRCREITWQIDSALGFGYLESYLSTDCCIFAVGEDADPADRLIASIAAEFEDEIYSEDELLLGISTANSPVQLARAVVRAGLGAPLAYDMDFANPISSAATSDEPRVRYAAIHTMLYMTWPQFVPLLKRIAHSDASDSVRSMAERVHSVMRNLSP